MDFLKRIYSFSVFLARRFAKDRCMATAGALSYTTLLSLVPLLAVVFSVVSAFPVFETAVSTIQNYIFDNFVPATGEVVQRYLQTFIQHTEKLTGPGIAFLVFTALILMDTIDDAVNHIWRVRKGRRLVLRLLVYWAVLTLGPMLLAVSIIVTSYLTSLPLVTDMGEGAYGMGTRLLSIMPVVSTTLALAVLYIIVPNYNVPVLKGLAAAGFAAVLFELVKKGFAVYVANATTYGTIYGALAVVPLFLIWIYVSWVVVLLGVELTYCLAVFKTERFRPVGNPKASELIAAYRVMGHLWSAQRRGDALSTEAVLGLEPRLRRELLHDILRRLDSRKVVHYTEDGAWGLARDPSEFTLGELYRIFPAPLVELTGDWAQSDHWNRELHARLSASQEAVRAALDVPLKQLYQCGEMHADEPERPAPGTGGHGALPGRE